MRIITLILLTSVVTLNSCSIFKKNKSETPVTAATEEKKVNSDCPDDLLCTMDFRMISIELSDGTNVEKAILDFPHAQAHKIKECKLNTMNGTTYVILATDSEMYSFPKGGEEVNLKLYSKGNVIKQERYVIGHDCCHIKLLKGATSLQL